MASVDCTIGETSFNKEGHDADAAATEYLMLWTGVAEIDGLTYEGNGKQD